jgi:hypothetical protein
MADTASEPEGPDNEASSKGEASSSGKAASRGEASSRSEATAKGEANSEDEARRKFREALERKRAKEGDTSNTRRGKETGKIHGVHGPARHRRSFRRKSGG